MSVRILLVEDDQKLGELLQEYLDNQGYITRREQDGEEIPAAIEEFRPNLIILDLMLPGKNGFDVCKEVRDTYTGKILFLTASEDDMDQVVGLELGADDFVKKPVQPRVLLARIRMLMRRIESHPGGGEHIQQLVFGGLSIKNNTREVYLHGKQVVLTPAEFDLLWLLANHADDVLSRDQLFKELRGIEFDGLDRSVDTKIVALRKKLEDNGSIARKIITVRGKGYLFASDAWNE
ncbi:response regulator transcription factor [Teredinibacter sp. KSP-S5-2]|uniref:response regulator transcription factor n=1 Tax=Teredinibacter sp. KSP-S5-2 TaxID=3034506 RepID=UPI002934510D|nr:response regulator transcription factor [Teredinibacter sp. KSP-S5-2]WNO09280.1 response regulator transcription factor [Teredinibacter sp. KSP-S5-2]